ncbi:MAG TPA: hypothetical protein PKH02_06335 [Bacteroidales bacterium]|nr:hypothetical protein [Bacteroidales bacterium]
MRTISQNLFDVYLREDGCLERYYNETQKLCFLFPYSAKGSLLYEDYMGLFRIGKYFSIQIMISFVDDRRYFQVRSVEELTLDEFLELIMREKEYKQTYETLIEFLK